MSSYSSSNILKLLIALLICGLLSTPLLGQSLFIEEAESTVVIQRDNLVRAKAEALKDAKAQVILQAVGRFTCAFASFNASAFALTRLSR